MGKSEYYSFTITPPKENPKTEEDTKWSAYSRRERLQFYEDTREQLSCSIRKEFEDEKLRCYKRKNKWLFVVVDETTNTSKTES